jgi:predicted transcriptional regulator
MAAKARRAEAKGPVERLHERIVAGDRGWFFAQIADRVAERRGAMGLSQRQLAELCGTTQSAIARLERGGRPPKLDTLMRIADALDAELLLEMRLREPSTE